MARRRPAILCAKQSDYNILIALNKIGPADLRNAHACVREWSRMGHPVPVYFTVSELQNAADVFPIEFHQMSVAHKVLFGPDVLAGLNISDKFLRHQAEYELAKQANSTSAAIYSRVIVGRWIEKINGGKPVEFFGVFRAVLILQGLEPPATKHEIVALAPKHLGLTERRLKKYSISVRIISHTLWMKKPPTHCLANIWSRSKM